MIAKACGMYKGVSAEDAKWHDEQLEVMNAGPTGDSNAWYFGFVAKEVAIGDEGRAGTIAAWKKSLCAAFAPVEAKMKEKSWKMCAGNQLMPLDIKIATFHTEFASNETVMEGLADAKEMMTEVFNEHPLIKGCVDNILAMDKCKAYLAARMKSPL